MLADDDIRRIVSRIVQGCAPLVVGTFGSYAIGRAHDGSDLDLFVIQRTVLPPAARARRVRGWLGSVLHPLDIHVFEPDAFEAAAGEPLSFAWVIARQARIWHAQPGALAHLPSLSDALRCLKDHVQGTPDSLEEDFGDCLIMAPSRHTKGPA